ncbi:MAG: hypothetical protein JO141_12050 [Bradyrhizobium sp.]|nr:hypothetical protein [Bradyrhizobium sp.]
MSTARCAHIVVGHSHHEPGSPDLSGVRFTLKYDGAQAEVSIPDMQALPFQDRLAACRAAIEDFALIQAVKDPSGITEG